ncbi:MAG: hypothetical protein ACI31V_04985 [Bacilli bacterium]
MKKKNKIFKMIFLLCFISYLTFYIAGQTGYYEYNARKKMTFTKEQIEKFENDVKEGKNIDMQEYLKNTDKNYQNKISKATLSLSENISKITRKGINTIFTKLGNAIEE